MLNVFIEPRSGASNRHGVVYVKWDSLRLEPLGWRLSFPITPSRTSPIQTESESPATIFRPRIIINHYELMTMRLSEWVPSMISMITPWMLSPAFQWNLFYRLRLLKLRWSRCDWMQTVAFSRHDKRCWCCSRKTSSLCPMWLDKIGSWAASASRNAILRFSSMRAVLDTYLIRCRRASRDFYNNNISSLYTSLTYM